MRLINTKTLGLRQFEIGPGQARDGPDDLPIPDSGERFRSRARRRGRAHGGLAYIILSHTWGKEEVSYREWSYLHNRDEVDTMLASGALWNEKVVCMIKAKEGYRKIFNACDVARRNGYDWLWADTICIDKVRCLVMSTALSSLGRSLSC
jgi:hypothetical protein